MRLLLMILTTIVGAQDSGLSSCCNALADAGLTDRVIASGVEEFEADVQKYFSLTAQLSPQCFFQPQSAEEVSLGVKTLVAAKCKFAIRSGGHMHFPGAAGIEDGVTFDLGMLNSITYHADNSSVSVGPGAVWGDVFDALDKLGVMVVGGRASTIGVGGLTLGGGNSYYAARYGLACDNVLRFEIVLGDGSIVTATRTEHPDLFQTLKGGGNNFGIVTRFDLAAFDNGPGGNIWGGVVTYPISTADQQLQAILDFGDNIEKDPYGSTIVISAFLSAMSASEIFMNAYDYTKPGASLADAAPTFTQFFAIPGNLSDSTGQRNMTSLAAEFDSPRDSRVSFSTLTFRSDIRVMKKAHEAFQQVVAKLKAEAQGDYGIYALYQPIPTLFAKLGNERGGNVLGLDRFSDNLILYESYLKWRGAEQDELFQSQAQWMRDEISSYAESIGADNEWLYLNYADKDQRPLEGYGPASVAKIRAAASKYDPGQVFQEMAPGGFKISAVEVTRKRGHHAGAVAGGVIGGAVGLAALCAISYFLWRRRQRHDVAESRPEATEHTYPPPDSPADEAEKPH